MTPVGLAPAQLSQVFPFHVAFDATLRIVQIGAAWPRLCAEVHVGAALADCFRLVRPAVPFDAETIRSTSGSPVLLECLPIGLSLRGQMLALGDPATMVFLGSPVLRDISELKRLGLSLDDWPPHEGVGEYLFLLQSKEAALADARELAAQLVRQRVELRTTVDALRAAAHERDQALASLVVRETTLGAIVDTALDAVITIDQDSRITLWNKQAESIFGWSRAEAIGSRLVDLVVPPSLREAHTQGLRKYLATGEGPVLNRRVEVPAQHRDGHEFPIELAISPIREGATLSFSAFVRDISVRKRNEQLLRSQYELTRIMALATSLSDAGPAILEGTCRLLEWDLGALWILDHDDEALRCVDVWHEPNVDLAAFGAATRDQVLTAGVGLPGRVLASGESLWLPRIAEDGNFPRAPAAKRCGLVSGVALPIPYGHRMGGVIEFFSRRLAKPEEETLRVLSTLATQVGQFVERTEATAALQKSNARTRATIDNMLEGLVVVGADLTILEVNPAFARIFDYAREDLLHTSILQLMPDMPDYQDSEKLTGRYRRSIGRATEHEGRRRDGTLFPIELQIYEIDTPEGTLTVAHLRDLSSEQAAERMKKQFVASVSHELRTPLTAIRGALGLLSLGAAGPLSADARPVVEVAERNAVRLMGIIDDILDFERMQSGVLSMSMAPFALDEAVERAMESAGTMARQSNIALVAPRTDLQVHGDHARIVQVLVNLVSNAIKFSPADAQVDITAMSHDGHAEVQVADRGRGVPDSDRTLIFEPFRQSEASDARRHGGAGLGLAICRAIVRQHGGEIGVRDRPDGGSVFWFTLPRRAPSGGTSGGTEKGT